MLSLGPLAFAQPWALSALLALPAIWWLLRLTPPLPKRVVFPPIRLLFGIITERETSARTPWWLLVLRILLATMIILAASRPLWNAENEIGAGGPVMLVIDNGWASADRWDTRRDVALAITDKAVRSGRQVILLSTAQPADGSAISVSTLAPADAHGEVAKLIPVPWPTDRGQAAQAVTDWAGSFSGLADIRWLSDGIDGAGSDVLAERLRTLGRVTVYGSGDVPVTVLRPPTSTEKGLKLSLERPFALAEAQSLEVRGLDLEGRVQAVATATFDAGATEAETVLDGPVEILNRVERVQIESGAHAGSVVLLDQRWRRRPVGIADVDGAAVAQPLLGNTYYVERALEGSTTLRRGPLSSLFQQPMSVLIVPDGLEFSDQQVGVIDGWLAKGGILVRFAGPALARRTSDAVPGMSAEPLLPVQLRGGDRIIGGAMSWRQPMSMMPFPDNSPFAGIDVPRDVRINRQVLAQPTPDLSQKTWARLSDGTPLVTAEQRDQGWIVLFHTAPNTSWSNLPISGAFVEMMQRLTALGRGVKNAGDVPPLTPYRIMNAFAQLSGPTANVQPIDAASVDTEQVSGQHPPGIYGAEDFRRAFNLTTSLPQLMPLPVADDWVRAAYEKPMERDMTGWLFLAALLLFFVDMAAGLWVRAGGRRVRRAATAMLVAGMAAGFAASPVHAADEKFALESSLETRIAYLETGNARVDDVSMRGLTGLTTMLARRTAAELGRPQPVEP
ncbi:MAG: BatA domain-containing protein, partial [Rhodospirillales bacterium]